MVNPAGTPVEVRFPRDMAAEVVEVNVASVEPDFIVAEVVELITAEEDNTPWQESEVQLLNAQS